MYNQIENTIIKYNDPNYKPINNNNNNINKEKILSKNNKEFQTKKDKINEEIISDDKRVSWELITINIPLSFVKHLIEDIICL